MKTKCILGVLGVLLAGSSALQAQPSAQPYYPPPYPQPYPQPVAQPLAQEPAGATRFEISPFYGYRFGGEVHNPLTGRTYRFQDSEAYGLFLDIAPRPNWPAKLELLWSRQDSSVDLHGLAGLGRVNLTIDEIQIAGSVEMGGRHLREYVSLLAGATYYSTEGYGSDTRLSMGLWRRSEVFFHPQPCPAGRPSRLLHHRGWIGRLHFQRRHDGGCLMAPASGRDRPRWA